MKLITQPYIFFASLTVAVLASLAISESTLQNLPNVWQREEYSHGPLLPLIALFIGWHNLSRKEIVFSSHWLGVVIFCGAFLIAVFAELSALQALLNYSFIISLFGIALAFFGKDAAKALLPSFILLFFAVPLPEAVISNLSLQLQLFSSQVGADIIKMFGYSVFQDGNIIDLGLMKLQVVEACNGLRYLFPLMSLAFLVAFLVEDHWWKRVFIFASSIPISIFMNILRIALIGVTVNVWGPEMAEGLVHTLEGFVIFGICFAILLAEAALILRFSKNGRFKDEYLALPSMLKLSKLSKPAVSNLTVTVLSLVFVSFFFIGPVKNRADSFSAPVDLSTFPMTIGDRVARKAFLSTEELDLLYLTDYWLADYVSPEEDEPLVNFYMAYYDSQRMRASIHIPLNCIVGSGWDVVTKERKVVHISKQSIPVVSMVARKNDQSILIYYWLEQRGRQINSVVDAKFFLALDSITINRTDGALVRLTTPIKKGETQDDAARRIQALLDEAYPHVTRHIPGRDLSL